MRESSVVRMCTSIVASNFVIEVSFASPTASREEYTLSMSTLAAAALYFFPCFVAIFSSVVQADGINHPPTSLVSHSNAHRTGSSFDLFHCAFQADRIEVLHFQLSDLLYLRARHFPD